MLKEIQFSPKLLMLFTNKWYINGWTPTRHHFMPQFYWKIRKQSLHLLKYEEFIDEIGE